MSDLALANASTYAAAKPGLRGSWYVLAVLTATYAVNFLDRQVVNILGESIKTDLGISDTQLGLLTGTAFGLFYSTLGVPIARLADRHSRVRIVTIALALWSTLTAACGAAQSYVQLFLLRVGVGVGEAGGTPPSYSLLSDYFPERSRTMALAIFGIGLPLGSFCGFLLGGFVDEMWGWRAAFMVAGVPGIILAILVRFTVQEPVRGSSDASHAANAAVAGDLPPIGVVLRQLLERKSFLRLVLGGTCGICIIYVTNAWLPPFFIRVHHLSTAEVGSWVALCVGLGGLIGSLLSGWLGTRLKQRFVQGETWMMAISLLFTAPLLLATLFAQATSAALASMFLLYVLSYMWVGPTGSLVQRVAPIRSRTLAAGLQLSIANVIALLLGPPLIGYLSDRLQPSLGVQSLRYALAAAAVASLVGAALYIVAGRHLPRDLER